MLKIKLVEELVVSALTKASGGLERKRWHRADVIAFTKHRHVKLHFFLSIFCMAQVYASCSIGLAWLDCEECWQKDVDSIRKSARQLSCSVSDTRNGRSPFCTILELME